MSEDTIDRAGLEKQLLMRANELNRSIQESYRKAEEDLQRCKEAIRNALRREDLTQPGLVTPEVWEARTVECTTNMSSWGLRLNAFWSVSGEPARRLFVAEEAANRADTYRRVGVVKELRWMEHERDLLRRLAGEVRFGSLGPSTPPKDEDF